MVMRKWTKAGLGFALTLGCSAQVAAQTAPAIVECKWNDGLIETYRITPTTWENWDHGSWNWKPRECKDPNSIPVKCSVSISSEQYHWKMTGREFIDNGRNWLNSIVNSYVAINRMSGGSVYTYQFDWESNKQPLKTSQNDRTGTCQGVKDPALLPKPAPPAPKF
jgi:hypothetical protein